MITRSVVAKKLSEYLVSGLPLEKIVDWAELAVMEERFDEEDVDMLREIVSRLGLADVRQFGLSWDECRAFLSRLGYEVQVEIRESTVG